MQEPSVQAEDTVMAEAKGQDMALPSSGVAQAQARMPTATSAAVQDVLPASTTLATGTHQRDAKMMLLPMTTLYLCL